jgi:capsular exopolysaccharide synthesis family protein
LTVIDSNTRYIAGSDNVTQTQPKTNKYVLGGTLAGFVFGILFVFVLDALDSRVRTAEDVARHLGLPQLGRLPRPYARLARRFDLAAVSEPLSPAAEDFRRLRARIQLANVRAQARTILVTSAIPEEGKSTVAANLAVEFARAGNKTLLIEGDLRRPSVNRYFHVENSEGTTEILNGTAALKDVMVDVPLPESSRSPGDQTGHGALMIVTAGAPSANPGALFTDDAMERLFAQAEEEADITLVDSSPVLAVADTLSLAGHLDAAVVIARASMVRELELEETRAVLDASGITTLGFVLTDATRDLSYSYYGAVSDTASSAAARNGSSASAAPSQNVGQSKVSDQISEP